MPNESLIHADVYFFVSTIALVIISIGVGVCLFYAIKILKNVREITDKVNKEATEAVADAKRLRHALRDEGLKWRHVADMARNFFIRKGKKIGSAADILKK